MSLTLLGWLLIASSITISALLILMLRSDAPRLALLSRLQSPSSGLGQDRRAATLIIAAAVFVLVAGIGSATSYFRDPATATGSGDTISQSHSGANGEMLASLKDYTRSIGAEKHAPMAAGGQLLPDVSTMIERLAARLETAPGDVKGWRMLGWSYFHTGRYQQAADALARAVELDPSSTELKLAYEEAKAKASESNNLEATPSLQAEAHGKNIKSEAMPQRAYDAAIGSMVDGLAARLESSPRDVEGWTRLIRSRVVLGEREVAAKAFRKALEVFRDDSAASGKITAAAIELGLKAE